MLSIESWLPRAQKYDASTKLFSQDERVHSVYIIAAGLVLLNQEQGRRNVAIGLRHAGGMLGFDTVSITQTYLTTATTLVTSWIHRVPIDVFHRLVETETAFANLSLEILSRELRTNIEEFARFCRLSPVERVGALLNMVSAAQITATPSSILELPPSLDREALADLGQVRTEDLDRLFADLPDWRRLADSNGRLAFVRRETASAPRSRSAPATDLRIGRALRSIEDRHVDPEFDLASLSRSMNLSPCYASRVFKRATSMRYRQALNAVRITRARQLLLDTTLSIKEVSAAVGFKHVSDLSHKFKAVYHVTPTAYRGSIEARRERQQENATNDNNRQDFGP